MYFTERLAEGATVVIATGMVDEVRTVAKITKNEIAIKNLTGIVFDRTNRNTI